MLERIAGPVIGMTGQMHLAIFANDSPFVVDQDRRVVMMHRSIVLLQLGVAKINPISKSFAASNSGRVAGLGISRSKKLSISASSSTTAEKTS